MGAVDLLLAAAPAFGIEVTLSAGGVAHVTLPLARPSGKSGTYELELHERHHGHVLVREQPQSRRLPAHCPERHINGDGSFCLYWQEGEDEARPVTDADSATDWWVLLNRYLNRQETAAQLGHWVGEARAHGDAAQHQRAAERIAARFGGKFAEDLRGGKLRVQRRERHSRALLELSRGDVLIARISTMPTAQIAHDLACPCDAGASPIGSCSSHRNDLKELILAVRNWNEGERRFYERLRAARVRCCGTMRGCPLQSGVAWGSP
ncbi:E2 domain-containing protein [Steroidobacter agaridevorans]|uniref:E2 domain-containing protein n=1 Tax=Steroidobacter agaridevorans TaxID=2695856 RepID=UPI001327999E|nr:E2 domain-containing protein [Steroidobacter agaridevorans]GFE87309.1 hypothetical protein GCM10011488_22630 [Steroidobacter agaridevorans]